MKNIIKKGSALVLATALLGTTSGTSLLLNGQINAPTSITATAADSFITGNSHTGKIHINESKIDVKFSNCTDIYYMKFNGVIKDFGRILPLSKRVRFKFNVDVNGTTKLELKQIKLNFECLENGNKRTISIKPSEVIINSSCKNYDLIYETDIPGNITSYQLDKINKLVRCNSATAESTDYNFITVTSPGEDLFIQYRKNDSLNPQVENWAKRMCIYANSLSQMTGVSLGTLYICTDDNTNKDMCPYSNNLRINSSSESIGYVGIPVGETTTLINRVKWNYNEIIWTYLHEIGHSYGCNVQPSTFYDNFYATDDEYFTNMRGLAAVQNCDNLDKTQIKLLDNCGETRIGYYNDITGKIIVNDKTSTDYRWFTYAKQLEKIGNKYGWEVLERFFAVEKYNGSKATDYEYDCQQNIEALKWVNELLGTNYSTSNEKLLKLTNSFRMLYKICKKSPYTIDKTGFKQFLVSEFAVDENDPRGFLTNLYKYAYYKK